MGKTGIKFKKESNNFLPNDKVLEAFRQEGDKEADVIIEDLMQRNQKEDLHKVFSAKSLKDIEQLPLKNHNFLSFLKSENQLPEWANISEMNKAGELFRNNGNDFLFVLGTVSLPYCYAGAKGAAALFHTEKIRNNTELRLLNTTVFVVDIMDENAFSPNGNGFLLVKQVRLRHALARYFLKKLPPIMQLKEVPVNQEDMAGTNLAFSYIALQAMSKIGLRIAIEQKEAYLHFWKVVGHLLGINEKLLPSNFKGAFWLEKQIAKRQFYPSVEGKTLTRQLISHYKNTIPNTGTKILIRPLIAYLNGKEVSKIIGIEDADQISILQKAMVFLPIFRKYIFPPKQSYQSIKNQIKEKLSGKL